MVQERITVDPNRMRGLPSIRDTRVTVSAVLGQLAAGASIDELLADYPYLEREDVLAALDYAAATTQECEHVGLCNEQLFVRGSRIQTRRR